MDPTYNDIDLGEPGGILIPEACKAIKFSGLHNVGHNCLCMHKLMSTSNGANSNQIKARKKHTRMRL